MATRVLILGASYGSLLGMKLALAGHDVTLVCLPAEADLINAKRNGKTIGPKPRPRGENVVDLMDALKKSLASQTPAKGKKPRKASAGQKEMLLPIEGKKQKVNGELVDAYYVCVGGAVGKHQATARPVGLRLPAREVATALERLLRAYLDTRRAQENFRAFAARHSDQALRALLAGDDVPAVARDAAGGLVPAGVDG